MATSKRPVMTRLDPELAAWLVEHAHAQRRSVSAVIEQLVRAEHDIAAGLAVENARETELLQKFTSGEHPVIP